MNDFEKQVILTISSFPNIAFWHRNLERGKGFFINGFKSNHYPDFIGCNRVLMLSYNLSVLFYSSLMSRKRSVGEAQLLVAWRRHCEWNV